MSLNRNDFDQSLKNGFLRGSAPVWNKRIYVKSTTFFTDFDRGAKYFCSNFKLIYNREISSKKLRSAVKSVQQKWLSAWDTELMSYLKHSGSKDILKYIYIFQNF